MGDLMSFDIFLPSPDDGSFEPKHYSVDPQFALLFIYCQVPFLRC